jgi:transcription termination/antitermination protein NusG
VERGAATYYALQVKTGAEARYVALARRQRADVDGRLFLLRRSLRVRRRGKWRDVTAPIFAGYVFFRAESGEIRFLETLRGLGGFIRFLPANDHVQPLGSRDESLLSHFLSFGDVAGQSTVMFDENSRIRVLSGPLKGLDGHIVKVDRRKQRARVRLSLYEESFEIDFGFQALEPRSEEPPTESAGGTTPAPPTPASPPPPPALATPPTLATPLAPPALAPAPPAPATPPMPQATAR